MNTTRISLSVPIVQYDDKGAIQPNTLFHRAFNKLHSRCIEYPFAAAALEKGSSVLDIGSSRADAHWLALLTNFSACVTFFDMSTPKSPLMPFVQGDCRSLPFNEGSFDMVFAISLIEHIGLLSPQVVGNVIPAYSVDGDMETLRQCRRVLTPGGKLVLTIPMGRREGYSPCASARVYTAAAIKKFSTVLCPLILDYYEYQLDTGKGFVPAPNALQGGGKAIWNRIPLAEASAENRTNMDGILCSVWQKEG